MSLEERVARIEGILEQMERRFSDLDKRFELMDKRIVEFREDFNRRLNHLETELRDIRGDLNCRFLWLLGVQISMWVTIILAILFK